MSESATFSVVQTPETPQWPKYTKDWALEGCCEDLGRQWRLQVTQGSEKKNSWGEYPLYIGLRWFSCHRRPRLRIASLWTTPKSHFPG